MNVSKYVAIFFFVFIQLISVGKVFANADEWMTTFRENIAQTWQQPEHYDLYIPAITWHARFAYDKEKTDRYNERPWGGGFGQSRWDEKGNWHGLYAMAFKDSWNKWEPIAGYGWESTRRPLADENFHLGLGFTAGVTARDNWNYIPLPVLLPLASVGYGPATFQMTYIPVPTTMAMCTLPGCAFSFETNEVLVNPLKSTSKIINIKNNATFITF